MIFGFVGPENLSNPGFRFPTPTARWNNMFCSHVSRGIFLSLSFLAFRCPVAGRALHVPSDPGFHSPTPTARYNFPHASRGIFLFFSCLPFRCLVARRTLIFFQILPTQAFISQGRLHHRSSFLPTLCAGYSSFSFRAFRRFLAS